MKNQIHQLFILGLEFVLAIGTLYNLFLVEMQVSQRRQRELIITGLQKTVELRQIVQYLRTYRWLSKISRFSKFQDKIKIQFIDEKEAHFFYYQNCFVARIIARTFNIYYSLFDDKANNQTLRYELVGDMQNNMRRIFQICNLVGKCRFRFSNRNRKINLTECVLQIEKNCDEANYLHELSQKLSQIQVSIRKLEDNQDQDTKFKCSIEIINFRQIHSIAMNKEELRVLEQDLKLLVAKVCSEPIKKIELMTFQDRDRNE